MTGDERQHLANQCVFVYISAAAELFVMTDDTSAHSIKFHFNNMTVVNGRYRWLAAVDCM